MVKVGTVWLVGAGPGDPGLMTLKAFERLKQAEVVVYDYLVNERFLQSLNPGAKTVYVGKKGPDHALEQQEINALLIEEARRGKGVVRLKGGDPFVFGRGGEEAEALVNAGVPFEVIPGVTSAIAAPAYAGIPVTHRDYTSTVAFVTGHEALTPPHLLRGEGYGRGGQGEEISWQALSQIGTVVFLMGVGNLPLITKNLMESGRGPETPVAVIEWGTLPRQKTALGTLQTIVDEVEKEGIRSPAVTVVGEVVSLSKTLGWFEKKPLFGKRILVTRSREQASELARRLEEEGAQVFEIPTIEIRSPSSWQGLDRAIRSISKYNWIIFTSVNGVDYFFGRLFKKGGDVRNLKGLKIAAIGPATARAIEERGIRVDSIAEEYRAEGVVKIFAKQKVRGKRILIPRAKEARELLVVELKKLGAKVDLVEAYRLVIPRGGADQLKTVIEGGADLITFASSSTVENFMTMAGKKIDVSRVPVASIGPVTTDTAKKQGLKVVIQPKKYTIPALVGAVVDYFLPSTISPAVRMRWK